MQFKYVIKRKNNIIIVFGYYLIIFHTNFFLF